MIAKIHNPEEKENDNLQATKENPSQSTIRKILDKDFGDVDDEDYIENLKDNPEMDGIFKNVSDMTFDEYYNYLKKEKTGAYKNRDVAKQDYCYHILYDLYEKEIKEDLMHKGIAKRIDDINFGILRNASKNKIQDVGAFNYVNEKINEAIQQALSENKSVPLEMLEYYPNLKKDNPTRHRWESSDIQTLLLAKSKFTKEQAKNWVGEHKYSIENIDETANYYRFRQKDPQNFGEMRTIEFTEGIKAVVGEPIKENPEEKNELPNKDDRLLELKRNILFKIYQHNFSKQAINEILPPCSSEDYSEEYKTPTATMIKINNRSFEKTLEKLNYTRKQYFDFLKATDLKIIEHNGKPYTDCVGLLWWDDEGYIDFDETLELIDKYSFSHNPKENPCNPNYEANAWKVTKKEFENNYYRVNYISTDGHKGYIIPYYYPSKEIAIKEALKDKEIQKITSVKKDKPSDWEHKVIVEHAIKNGKKVPAKVLADYPELVKPEPDKVFEVKSYTPYQKMNRVKTRARVQRLKALFDAQDKGYTKAKINNKIVDIQKAINSVNASVGEQWEARGWNTPEATTEKTIKTETSDIFPIRIIDKITGTVYNGLVEGNELRIYPKKENPLVSMSDLRKGDSQTLFEGDVNYDTRKNLNRSPDVIIEEGIIDEIEKQGVTVERLEKLPVTIFKYKTQITIHGDFGKITKDRIFGYKSLLLNQNLSLGVKYNAIDGVKKGQVYKALYYYHRHLHRMGESTDNTWDYNQDSRGTELRIMWNEVGGNLQELKKKAKLLFDTIPNTFIGDKDVKTYAHKYYGGWVVITITLNAIYQKDLWKFIQYLTKGKIKNETDYNALVEENEKWEEQERLKREEEYKKGKLASAEKFELDKKRLDPAPYQVIDRLPDSDKFIVAYIGKKYDDTAEIRVVYIYKKKGWKYYYTEEFNIWGDIKTKINENADEKGTLKENTIKRLNEIAGRGHLFLIWSEQREETKTAPETISPKQRQKQAQGTVAGTLTIENYSDKAIIVKGDTLGNLPLLQGIKKQYGVGIWHRTAGGWIFPKKFESQVRQALLSKITQLRQSPITKELMAILPERIAIKDSKTGKIKYATLEGNMLKTNPNLVKVDSIGFIHKEFSGIFKKNPTQYIQKGKKRFAVVIPDKQALIKKLQELYNNAPVYDKEKLYEIRDLIDIGIGKVYNNKKSIGLVMSKIRHIAELEEVESSVPTQKKPKTIPKKTKIRTIVDEYNKEQVEHPDLSPRSVLQLVLDHLKLKLIEIEINDILNQALTGVRTPRLDSTESTQEEDMIIKTKDLTVKTSTLGAKTKPMGTKTKELETKTKSLKPTTTPELTTKPGTAPKKPTTTKTATASLKPKTKKVKITKPKSKKIKTAPVEVQKVKKIKTQKKIRTTKPTSVKPVKKIRATKKVTRIDRFSLFDKCVKEFYTNMLRKNETYETVKVDKALRNALKKAYLNEIRNAFYDIKLSADELIKRFSWAIINRLLKEKKIRFTNNKKFLKT